MVKELEEIEEEVVRVESFEQGEMRIEDEKALAVHREVVGC